MIVGRHFLWMILSYLYNFEKSSLTFGKFQFRALLNWKFTFIYIKNSFDFENIFIGSKIAQVSPSSKVDSFVKFVHSFSHSLSCSLMSSPLLHGTIFKGHFRLLPRSLPFPHEEEEKVCSILSHSALSHFWYGYESNFCPYPLPFSEFLLLRIAIYFSDLVSPRI